MMHGHKEFCASTSPLVTVQRVSGQEARFDFIDHVLEVCDEGRVIVTSLSGGTEWEVIVGEGVIDMEVVVSFNEVFKEHWLENICI